MNDWLILRLARAFFGLLAFAAMATQLISLRKNPTFSPVMYFSYFTIDSNLVAAVVLLTYATRPRPDRPHGLDVVRGAAVVYMSVTGIVFTLLLSGTDVDTTIPWVNSVVHELMPLVLMAHWLLDPPAVRVTVRQATTWLAFPFVWIVYTLIRGSIIDRYPYPFLDPAKDGYSTVAQYCVGIFILIVLVCAVVRWIGNTRSSGELVAPGTSHPARSARLSPSRTDGAGLHRGSPHDRRRRSRRCRRPWPPRPGTPRPSAGSRRPRRSSGIPPGR